MPTREEKQEAQRLKKIAQDRAMIEKHGGPTVLAKKLMLGGQFPARRVQHWMDRGIPASIKLMYPEYFLPQMKRAITKGGKK